MLVESEDEEIILGIIKLPARYIFSLSSGISFIFIATGVVAYLNVQEDNALTIKEKVVLIIIHLIKIGLSLFTSTILILMKTNRGPSFGFFVWLAIITGKILLLSISTAILRSH